MFQRQSLVHHQVAGDEWCVCPLLTYTSQNPHEPVRCRYKQLAHITHCISNLMLGDNSSFQNTGYQFHHYTAEKTSLHIITIKLNKPCISTSTCNAVANCVLCDDNKYVFMLRSSMVIQILKIHCFCVMYVWDTFSVLVWQCWGQEQLTGCSELSNVTLGSIKCHECLY
jgi:hypothetical protein